MAPLDRALTRFFAALGAAGVLAWEGFTDDSSAAFVFAAALLLYALPGLVVALLSLASHTSDDETRKPKRKR